MIRYLTPEQLLSLAAVLPDDPACDDLGKLDAVLARPRAHYMGTDVYGSDWLKAAALLEAAALLRPLEQHNDLYAWSIAEVFLQMNGHELVYDFKGALALVADVRRYGMAPRQVARRLREWATS